MSTHDTSPDTAADLRQFDQAWAKASAPEEDFYSDIPDGPYEAVIEEARVTETATTGRPMVVWKLRLQGPVAAHRSLPKVRVITDNTVAWLREDLRKCGLNLERLSELPQRIHEIEGLLLPIEKRTKDGRMNVYFRWPDRKPPPVADDGLPF
ncbi:MAG: DUF669 domain-containing protein [Acidobacteria bacterium]|nr:DUF669 domain-containing protein [Acidobacteriota bacterium]